MIARKKLLITIVIQLILSQIFVSYGAPSPEDGDTENLEAVSKIPSDKDDLQKISDNIELFEKESVLILQQFDSIINGLKIFETELQPIPGTMMARPKCEVSKQKLENLKKEIVNSLKGVTNEDPTKCTLDINGPDNCNELTKMIMCGVQQLKDGFSKVSKSGSLPEITKWRNAYEQLAGKYEKEIEDLKLTLTQEYRLKLDKVLNEFQHLNMKLNQALERLQETRFDHCILAIRTANIDSALKHSKDFNLYLMAQIIKEVYYGEIKKDNEPNGFENIMNFIKKQQSAVNNIKLYDVLHYEMSEYYKGGKLKTKESFINFKKRLCILEIITGKLNQGLTTCNDRDLNQEEIIKSAYNYPNQKDEKIIFENIMNYITKQELNLNVKKPDAIKRREQYSEILMKHIKEYNKLHVLESCKIHLCVLSLVLGKIDEANIYFKSLESTTMGEIAQRAVPYDERYNSNTEKLLTKQKEICVEILGLTTRYNHFRNTKSSISLTSDFDQTLFDRIISNREKCVDASNDFLSNLLAFEYYKIRFDVSVHFNTLLPALKSALKEKEALNDNFFIHFILGKYNKNLKDNAMILSMVYDALQNENLMSEGDLIIYFAYYLKLFMARSDYNTLDGETKGKIEKLKQELPAAARKIMWHGDKCKLRNPYMDEYMFAHDRYYLTEKRSVMTRSVNGPKINDAQSQWMFVFEPDTSTPQFVKIKNIHFNEWLYQSTDSYVWSYGFVYTDPSKYKPSKWDIDIINNGTLIKIYNTRYLTVDSSDKWHQLGHKIKYVRNSDNSEIMSKEQEWELICQ